jgi:hypothetical protein
LWLEEGRTDESQEQETTERRERERERKKRISQKLAYRRLNEQSLLSPDSSYCDRIILRPFFTHLLLQAVIDVSQSPA